MTEKKRVSTMRDSEEVGHGEVGLHSIRYKEEYI